MTSKIYLLISNVAKLQATSWILLTFSSRSSPQMPVYAKHERIYYTRLKSWHNSSQSLPTVPYHNESSPFYVPLIWLLFTKISPTKQNCVHWVFHQPSDVLQQWPSYTNSKVTLPHTSFLLIMLSVSMDVSTSLLPP